MAEAKWTPDLLKELLDDQIGLIRHDLEGFPERYATHEDVKLMRSMIEDIRQDHVHRREMDEVKQVQHESSGRRNVVVVALSVMMTLLAIIFTLAYKNQPTTQDIRAQIQTESPWASDRPQIELRLMSLERQLAEMKGVIIQHNAADKTLIARLTAIEKLDVFFCRTRAQKGLAPC